MGGIGAIYRAEHLHMHNQVAIKVLHPQAESMPELVARFEREAIAGAHIQHPNVACATDFGKFDGKSRFLVLEYIRGKTLRDVIDGGPVAPARAARIAKGLALALAASHDKGIFHRDVKPRNVMLADGPGNTETVKLIDFGLAKVPVEELSAIARETEDPRRSITQAGIVMGTVAYLAPEAALGMRSVRAPADLYAMGVVLYELLTGLHPFDADKPAAMFACHRATPPPPMARRNPAAVVPPALEALVMKLLAKDPDDRFASAEAVARAIDAAVAPPRAEPRSQHELTPLTATRVHDRDVTVSKRGAALWVAGGLAVFATVAAASFLVGRGGARGDDAAHAPVAATASATATPAASSSAPQPEVHEHIRAAAESGDAGRCVASLSGLLRESPSAFSDRSVQSESAAALEVAAAAGKSADALFERISALPVAGQDILYDLVAREAKVDATERPLLAPPLRPGSRARALLARPDVIAKGSAAMRVAHELRSSPCARRPFLFARAGADGDDRALLILTSMQAPTCGPQGGGCCTKHPELARAIAAIETRLRP